MLFPHYTFCATQTLVAFMSLTNKSRANVRAFYSQGQYEPGPDTKVGTKRTTEKKRIKKKQSGSGVACL